MYVLNSLIFAESVVGKCTLEFMGGGTGAQNSKAKPGWNISISFLWCKYFMKCFTDDLDHQVPGLIGFQLLGCLVLFSGNGEVTEHHGGDGKQRGAGTGLAQGGKCTYESCISKQVVP